MQTILKQVREQKGFTQVEIADKASIAVRAYQRYEAGERVPNVHTAISIANALHTDVKVLFSVIIPEQD